MRRAAARLAFVLACCIAGGGCASILGIEEQTFDGGDGDDGRVESDGTTVEETMADSGEGDVTLLDGRSESAINDSATRADTTAPANDSSSVVETSTQADTSTPVDSPAGSAETEPPTPCPQCAGCCDQDADCSKGTSATQCGVDGVYCQDCTATGLVCHTGGICR
jgi:hypothetical protein